jgi:hypothetical protein
MVASFQNTFSSFYSEVSPPLSLVRMGRLYIYLDILESALCKGAVLYVVEGASHHFSVSSCHRDYSQQGNLGISYHPRLYQRQIQVQGMLPLVDV